MSPRITRLAPSPTGALHLGNARTFLINWAMAKQNHWKIVLRIEDLDTPRVKPGAKQQSIEDLAWLGMDWDEGPIYQMNDLAPYFDAIARLHQKDLLYACSCSRSEIAAAQSAPNLGDVEQRYPGTCRRQLDEAHDLGHDRNPGIDRVEAYLTEAGGAKPRSGEGVVALRVVIPDEPIVFDDMIAGRQSIDVQQHVGDFVIATKANLPAYQLAVVVDDARQGVTDIVRGDDLIPSAARQLWLYKYLDITPSGRPRYWHVPLVIGEDGRRLAKRHGDSRLSWYRDEGVPAERVIGLVGRWCGIVRESEPMSAIEFARQFDVARLPREPMVFSARDHAFLMGSSG